MSKAEVVVTGLGFPEGPVVLPDGRVAFCEEYGQGLRVFDGTGLQDLAKTGGAPNGATLGSDGNLYVAQNGGVQAAWRADEMITPCIQRVSLAGDVEDLLFEVAGRTIMAPNDICFGPDGRLYFTDPAHGFDPDNKKDGYILAAGEGGEGEVFVSPGPVYDNGLGFLPDGTLIWVESYTRNVMKLGERGPELIYTLPENHIPDGFAVAEDGRIFIASVFSHGIDVISPEGEYLGLIELDDEAVCTNCAFDGSTLWATDCVGIDHTKVFFDGRLWKIETDAVGMKMHAGQI
ncbi:MAG TPA: SMP-30/gluconolactonase/LRE family protein [Actinomycetota bacterium]|nr:SMP-30/gluconolactonase/LRE family protein [Actinomycetota bacterium]